MAGLTNLGRKGPDIASAATILPGGSSKHDRFDVTGTTAIGTIQTGRREVGARFWLNFAGSLTISNDNTRLKLPGGDLTTVAGQTLLFEVIGTNQVRLIAGLNGDPGIQGDPGIGVAPGGTAGQVLSKVDGADYNTQWTDPTGGVDPASQAEAEAGIDNSKTMTPLRTAEAIASLVVQAEPASGGVDEVHVLTFTDANPEQFFGLFSTAIPGEVGQFRVADYADDAALKTGLASLIAGLSAYAGQSPIITGTLTRTDVVNGQLTVTYSGGVDSLGAVQGAVKQFLVTGGDYDADYQSNSGAAFALGIDATTYQANQRALAGQFANVLCAGSSTPPVPQTVTPGEIWWSHIDGEVLLGTNQVDSNPATGDRTGSRTGGTGFAYIFSAPVTLTDISVLFGLVGNPGPIRLIAQPDATSHSTMATAAWNATGMGDGPTNVFVSDLGSPTTGQTVADSFTPIASQVWVISSANEAQFYINEIQFTTGPDTPGSATISSYFPTDATPPTPTAAGTGASASSLESRGATTQVVPSVDTDGADSGVGHGGLVTVEDKTLLFDIGNIAPLKALQTDADGNMVGVDIVSPTAIVKNTQTGTTYTLVLGDAGKVVECDNAGAITLTIPPVADVAWPVNTFLEVCQLGAGAVTISGGEGVTLHSFDGLVETAGQYASVGLRMRSNDIWILNGALS